MVRDDLALALVQDAVPLLEAGDDPLDREGEVGELGGSVLARMEFKPQVSAVLKTMDANLFAPELMGLAATLPVQPDAPVRRRRRATSER